MKKLVLLFLLVSGYVFSQTNCELCVEQGGFYCGDDESNWTQYSPNGCVPNGFNDLFYLNDGWSDCNDSSDENNATSTTIADCGIYGEECDTIYITEYETIYETIFDTIIEVQVYEEIDTLYIYEDILDTLFIDVIEYVEIFVIDTIVEYETDIIYIEEFIDCDTGLPCNTSIIELMNKSKENNKIYNVLGKEILRPEGLYIQNGKVKYKLN
tara:strand:- start:6168 stop:6803 length:636 start_codon:yes stop_codon:yes gene_type:complete